MVGRGIVFVRAQSPSGRYYTADVFDLDEPSFRSFVLEMLRRAGKLSYIIPADDGKEEEEFVYQSRREPE